MEYQLEIVPIRAKCFNITLVHMGAPANVNLKGRFRDADNYVWQFDFGCVEEVSESIGGIDKLFNGKWCLIEPLESLVDKRVIKGRLLSVDDDNANECSRILMLQARHYLLKRHAHQKYIKRDDGLIDVAQSQPHCLVFHPWKMEYIMDC